MEEMIAAFDIANVNKAASAFNPDKLLWLNQQHILRASPERLAEFLVPQFASMGIDVASQQAKLVAVARAQQQRAKTLKEMAQNSTFFFIEPPWYEEKAAKKHLTAEGAAALRAVQTALSDVAPWSSAAIHAALESVATQLGVGLGKIAQPIRVAVSGTTVSPPIDVTLEILGREVTLARIEKAIAYASTAS